MDVFFRRDNVPVQPNTLLSTRKQALQCPKGTIELAFCPACESITNWKAKDGPPDYSLNYENSLHFSPSYREYARGQAADLVERYRLQGKVIVDVGCGRGDFLAMLCDLGQNRGFGFDPAYANGRGNAAAGRGVTYVKEFYSEAQTSLPCDFICCRQVLEHVLRPKEFVATLQAAALRSGAPVFFEVPNARYTFQRGGIWDIIYEHPFYYSSQSLRRLFASCGFRVSALRESFGGQYLCLEAVAGNGDTVNQANEETAVGSLNDDIEKFAERHKNEVSKAFEICDGLRRSGKRTVVWGAGSKGISFLNELKTVAPVKYTVDVNPHKWGKFVPGTGHEIVSPEFLKEYQPECIIIMNANYRDEIRQQLEACGLRPEVRIV